MNKSDNAAKHKERDIQKPLIEANNKSLCDEIEELSMRENCEKF